jgi:hypothetical protein
MTNAKNNPNFKHNAKTEKFKRPDHPDFKTTEEHKKANFSGVRKNDMTLQYEFWILGEIVKTVHFLTAKQDKDALKNTHLEVFCMLPDEGKILFSR